MPGENIFMPNDNNKRDTKLLGVQYNTSRRYLARDEKGQPVEVEDYENFMLDDARMGKMLPKERDFFNQAIKSVSLRINYLRLIYRGEELLRQIQDDEYIKFAKDNAYKVLHVSVSTHDGRGTMLDSMLKPHSISEVREAKPESDQPKQSFMDRLQGGIS